MKTALGVIVEAKLISVLNFSLYFHCNSQRNLFPLFLGFISKCTANVKMLVGILNTHYSSLYVLDINPLSEKQLAKNFSHSVGCLHLLMVSFGMQKVFNKVKSQ